MHIRTAPGLLRGSMLQRRSPSRSEWRHDALPPGRCRLSDADRSPLTIWQNAECKRTRRSVCRWRSVRAGGAVGCTNCTGRQCRVLARVWSRATLGSVGHDDRFALSQGQRHGAAACGGAVAGLPCMAARAGIGPVFSLAALPTITQHYGECSGEISRGVSAPTPHPSAPLLRHRDRNPTILN